MLFIKELNLISFGKFQDESFQFQEGLNLVCGANEAGKSTLHHFIKGMLFGIERSRGRASKEDPYQGFLPWDNKGCYCGTMDVAEGEQEFRIYRDFLKESKESKLTELRTGHEVQLLSGMELPFAPELTERLYHSTISVPQRQANSSKDLASEYGKYIANLSTTMSNELDTEAAITYLTAKKKKIESLKTEEKLSMCEEKLQELEQAEMKAAQLAKQLEGLLETYQSSDESQERKQQIGQLKDYADEYSVIREKYIRYQEYKSKSDIIEEQGKNLSRQKKQNKTEIKKLQNLKILKIILIACLTGLVWIILLIILVGITNIVLPGAIGAFVLYLAAAGAVKRAKRKIETGGYLASPERDELKSRHSELQDMMSVLKEEILTYARRYTDITDIDAESMEVLSREIVKLKESVSEKMASMQKEQEDIRLNIERLRWELGNAMHALEDMYEERQKYKELQEIRRSELLELEALAAAAETIKELAKNIYDSFGADLNHKISDLTSFFTDGKYSNVKVDSNFSIKVEYNKRFIPAERLSTGTIDLIYLALRLAAADVFFGEKKLPLIFDDVFAYYDDERLKQVLNKLKQFKNRQIIIFTCHKRERELLGDECNYIELT